MGKRFVVWTQFMLGACLPCLLQLLGTFTPYWLIQDGIYKGFFYQIDSEEEIIWLKELDPATLGLQMTSSVLLLMFAFHCVITVTVYGPDEDGVVENYLANSCCFGLNACCFFFSIFLYFCTGIFSLAGCARFSSVHPLEYISVSYYLCLASSLVIWLNIFVFFCDKLCKRRSHKNVFNTFLYEIYGDALDS